MNPKWEKTARKLPGPVVRTLKRAGAYPRYWQRCHAAREGYQKYGSRYRNHLLFIAGLPKSGTTWLKKMIASYPGFAEVLIPEVTRWEMSHGTSHDFDLPVGCLDRFDEMLVLTKMHVHGSRRNVAELQRTRTPYVVLYRDLRDVAVSYVHYVGTTPWHPEHPAYNGLSLEQGLLRFGNTLLEPYAEWIQSWRSNHDAQLGCQIRYEDLVAQPQAVFAQVAQHLGLDDSADNVARVVEEHSFARMSGGRPRGAEAGNSFFRKGVAGDWKNCFTPALAELYDERAGWLLNELGYDADRNS